MLPSKTINKIPRDILMDHSLKVQSETERYDQNSLQGFVQ